MQCLSFFWAGLSGLKSLWSELQRLDKAGVRRFSDQWAREVRKWLEIKIVKLAMYEDTRIAKMFGSFSQFLHCCLIILKSDSLTAVEQAKGDNEKLKAAIAKLEGKETLYARPGQPGAGGYHQP